MTTRPKSLPQVAALLLAHRRRTALGFPASLPVAEVAQHTIIAQLGWILRYSADLPKHRLEIDELPFDRFLLTYSEAYLSTRIVARELGICVHPRVTSKIRALTDFDPRSDTISFSPILPELQWACAGASAMELRLKAFETLRDLTVSTYHELNHAIFFRSAHPAAARSNSWAIKNFFNLNESLAVVRDLELARELGSVGQPLCWAGTVYRACSTPPAPLCRLEPAAFRYVLLSVFLNLCGYSPTAIRRVLGEGETGIEAKLLRTSREFVDGTASYWLKEYRARRPRRIDLPPRSASCAERFPVLHLSRVSPKALINSSAETAELFRLYSNLFYRSSRQGPRQGSLGSRRTRLLSRRSSHSETTL